MSLTYNQLKKLRKLLVILRNEYLLFDEPINEYNHNRIDSILLLVNSKINHIRLDSSSKRVRKKNQNADN